MKRPLIAALVFVAIAAFASAAFASSTATVKPGQYVLVNADNSLPAGLDATTNRFDSLQACSDAAAKLTGAPTFKCNQSNLVTITRTCVDEKAPHIDMPKNSDGGFDEPDAAAFPVPGDDTQWRTLQWLFVHNSKWPDGYPNCWVRGWEDPTLWRVNPKAEAPKVFMERIEPGMTAADVELPDVEEPVCPQSNTDPRCPPWVAAS
jgi:hypothetical protein